MESAVLQPVASVIVVNYNALQFLQACLDLLAAQSCANFEAIIVDNASTDGSRSQTRLPDERFRWLDAGSNLGFAAANNLAAAQARGRFIVCLNPDAFANPDWLETLITAAEQTGAIMAGSLQVDAQNDAMLDGAGDMYLFAGIAWRALHGMPRVTLPDRADVFGPCAAASLYQREAFLAVGGFDARFFCYHEDVDLALRLRRAGGRCVQVNTAIVRHVGSGIAGKRSDFASRLGSRNRLWTYLKSFPSPWVWVLLPAHLVLTALWLLATIQRGGFIPALYGFFEAVKGVKPFLQDRALVDSFDKPGGQLWHSFTYDVSALLRRGLKARPWRT